MSIDQGSLRIKDKTGFLFDLKAEEGVMYNIIIFQEANLLSGKSDHISSHHITPLP